MTYFTRILQDTPGIVWMTYFTWILQDTPGIVWMTYFTRILQDPGSPAVPRPHRHPPGIGQTEDDGPSRPGQDGILSLMLTYLQELHNLAQEAIKTMTSSRSYQILSERQIAERAASRIGAGYTPVRCIELLRSGWAHFATPGRLVSLLPPVPPSQL